MRPFLAGILACPSCAGAFKTVPLVEAGGGSTVEAGLLVCACGAMFPVIDTIPRMLPNAFELFPAFTRRYRGEIARHRKAQADGRDSDPDRSGPADEAWTVTEQSRKSFGYQWSEFSEMVCDFRENFLNYIHPVGPEFFPGKVGLDAGVGFGRHIFHAASLGAEMVGMDLSAAVDAARRNTRGLERVHLVQGDIYHPPFRPETFDFVYSIGVLHHLSDPARGFRRLQGLVKPGGAFFVWLYSSQRRRLNRLLESARVVTTRLPYRLLKAIALGGAVVDWGGFILPYRMGRRLPGVGEIVERLAFERIKLYSRYPFQVAWADWFDRLSAPLRFYYSGPTVTELFRAEGLERVRVSPTGRYGWRGYGEKPRHAPIPGGTAPC